MRKKSLSLLSRFMELTAKRTKNKQLKGLGAEAKGGGRDLGSPDCSFSP